MMVVVWLRWRSLSTRDARRWCRWTAGGYARESPDDLHAKFVQIADECGKTPPLPGVRNSSEGPRDRAWCSQGYTTMLAVKPLRP